MKAYPISRIETPAGGYLLALRAAIGGVADIPPLPITLIVDTGAARTIIDPDILQRAGCRLDHSAGEVPILTAGGKVARVPLVTVPWFHCLGQRISPWTVVALPLPPELKHSYGVGLLGMDFLAHFDAVIDIGRREIRLKRTPSTGKE